MIKRFLCWIGWHGPVKELDVIGYSNRSIDLIEQCRWCAAQWRRSVSG